VFVLLAALLLNANLHTRTNVTKSSFFNSFLVVREMERGWPIAYQKEFESEFVSFRNQESIENQTTVFFEKGIAITSPVGLFLNVSCLILFVAFCQFVKDKNKKNKEKNKGSGQEKNKGSGAN
jgi:hypothetical protein